MTNALTYNIILETTLGQTPALLANIALGLKHLAKAYNATALLKNIVLGWKCPAVSQALSYSAVVIITIVKCFI